MEAAVEAEAEAHAVSCNADPCFVPAASAVDDRRGSMGLDFDDSGDLFSMGRVDSGWLEVSKSRKDNGGAASVGDQDADSDLLAMYNFATQLSSWLAEIKISKL
ncbi:hypothetical protein GUJ93_ZPchr0001g31889 [Zizania palustris]|uniref:Uncharacterized protein n=1 Tax=Zizania palustris TaxID=103762 RepID=A0A8J5S9G4_ZIZPA|nr:hypothetical protein GUJ93_ZPchr0001g31889 [Zizania palustris]